jgi:hypothetical protein|tara:strand:- start:186 stop:449 length:264 start_codon:yes stop_codon:yes gene_type:complete
MSWSLNKDKAKERFLKTYRRERDKKLLELDVEYMKALESTDTSEQTSIVSQKNTLRDFPSTITNDSFSTIDELRALWPSTLDLPRRW